MQYLRYTTIHHDVREYFKLTICEYMVCDSIHQLSHGAPTKQPNTKIAKHLGIDEGSVRNAKKTLIEKKLIAEVDGGVTSTEKWNHFVTFREKPEPRQNSDKIRKNSEVIRKNSDSYNIYKDNIIGDSKESQSKCVSKSSVSDKKYESVPLDDDGIPVSPRKKPETTRDAPKVFAVFKEEVGNFPPNWLRNKTERKAAQSLYEIKGIDKIRKALRFWNEHRDEAHIPDVFTPWNLEYKWDKLIRFRKKNGL